MHKCKLAVFYELPLSSPVVEWYIVLSKDLGSIVEPLNLFEVVVATLNRTKDSIIDTNETFIRFNNTATFWVVTAKSHYTYSYGWCGFSNFGGRDSESTKREPYN